MTIIISSLIIAFAIIVYSVLQYKQEMARIEVKNEGLKQIRNAITDIIASGVFFK